MKTEQLRTEVAVEGKQRRFRMRAYSGAPIERSYGQLVFDVTGVESPSKLPILLNHDEGAVVGYADGFERAPDGAIDLVGALVSTPEGDRVAKLSDEKFPWTASIGVQCDDESAIEEVPEDKEVLVNGRTLKGPLTVWRRCRLFETSFVTAGPADRNTAAAVLKKEQTVDVEKLKAEAVAAEKARVAEFEKTFPHRPGFGLAAYLAGKTLEQARAEDAEILRKENADLVERLKKAEDAEKLRAQVRHPGLGFDGQAREAGSAEPDLSHLPPEARAKAEWKRDPVVRECFRSEEHLAAYYRQEERGIRNLDAIEEAARVLVRNSVEA